MSEEFSVAQAVSIFTVCYLNHDSWHQLGLRSTTRCSGTLLKAGPGLQERLRGAGSKISLLAAEGSLLQMSCWQEAVGLYPESSTKHRAGKQQCGI